MKKKVVFFVTNLDSGGIENYLLRFLKYNRNRLDAYVICKSGKLGVLLKDYEAIGVKVLPFRIGYVDIRAFRRLYIFLKLNRFDSACDFTGNFAAFPLLVAACAGVSKRIAFYRNAENRFKGGLFRAIFNNMLNFIVKLSASKILSNSYAALKFYHKRDWKNNPKYEVIYNGLDSNTFLAERKNLRPELRIPQNAFVIGHVGRYNPAKNHMTMIDVANRLCNQYDDIYFLFCGSNVDQVLKHYSEKVNKRIIFLPFRKDVNNVLYSLDAFYFPSLTEGQPNALIEAMVSDLPIVASNIAPIQEILPKQFHEDMLVSPLDKEGAIEKLRNIYLSEDRKGILGEWARQNFQADLLFGKFFDKL